MIVTVTYGGKPFGSPMDDLREDDLLWFIKTHLKLGLEVHITPEPAMTGDTCSPKEIPPSQTAPRKVDGPKKWHVQLPEGKFLWLESNTPHEDLATLGHNEYALTQVGPPPAMKPPRHACWTKVKGD